MSVDRIIDWGLAAALWIVVVGGATLLVVGLIGLAFAVVR